MIDFKVSIHLHDDDTADISASINDPCTSASLMGVSINELDKIAKNLSTALAADYTRQIREAELSAQLLEKLQKIGVSQEMADCVLRRNPKAEIKISESAMKV
jgi:hypothetical protein